MQVISANLNGIRSATSKGFLDWMSSTHADVVCVQELKAQESDLSDEMRAPLGFTGHFHYAEKKGYSGVGIYCRQAPKRITQGLGNHILDAEGRWIRVDFEKVSIVSVYIPSGSSGPERQAVKYQFLDIFFDLLQNLLQEKRDFIICGDWNIAHTPQDIKNWRSNQKNSGFLPEERAWLDKLYANGWVDTYRQLYPENKATGYTWWSNRGQAYVNNVGWRIDLQVATQGMASKIQSAEVFKDIKFSDHAPLIINYNENLS